MSLPQGQDVGFQPESLWSTSLGVSLARGQFLKVWSAGTVTFTSAAVAAASVTEQAVTVTGTQPGDVFVVIATGAPTANVGNLGTARVSAAGTIQLRYVNPTAGALTPPASTVYNFVSFQVS